MSRSPIRRFDIELDRNTQTVIPDGSTTSIAYGFGTDRNGQPQFQTLVTDANGAQKRTHRDVRDLIVSIPVPAPSQYGGPVTRSTTTTSIA